MALIIAVLTVCATVKYKVVITEFNCVHIFYTGVRTKYRKKFPLGISTIVSILVVSDCRVDYRDLIPGRGKGSLL
jgi:hypothetical protein